MTWLAQTILHAATGNPADDMVNTAHWDTTAPPLLTDFDNVRDMLKNFYTLKAAGSAQSLAYYLTTQALDTTATVKLFDLADAKPRPPRYIGVFSLTGIGNSVALPTEVALCASFQAAPTAGVEQARRRNRFYVGGFGTNAIYTGGLVTANCYNDMARSLRDLKLAGDAAASWEMKGYSPTDGTSFGIHKVWVDNAFDTQRRRGVSATARAQYSV